MGSLLSWISDVDKRIFIGLSIFVILLLALPLTIFEVQQQQQTQQKASSGPNNQGDTCGFTTVTFAEIPASCAINNSQPAGSLHTYSSSATISLARNIGSGKKIVIDWDSMAHVCATNSELHDPNGACLSNGAYQQGQCTLTDSNSTCTMTSATQSVDGKYNNQYNGEGCGIFQTDFAFDFNGATNVISSPAQCHYGTNIRVATEPGGFTYCNAGACTVQNTPTPSLTSTPTPGTTNTPTPTPGITVTDTPTPTVTNTPTPTATGTQTPTPTSTPGPSATDTPGPTATNTPGPTATPTPITNTPHPSLPPTGPNNTFVTIGIVGALALIAGLAALAF